jgi:hypothetical protein
MSRKDYSTQGAKERDELKGDFHFFSSISHPKYVCAL